MKNFFRYPLVNVLFFSIFWALEIFNTKLAFLAGADVVRFSIQSAFVTFIIISLYVLPQKITELKMISFHSLKWLIIANAIHMGVGSFLSYAGVQMTTAINAGFITQFTIVTGTILAWLILKEKMTIPKTISIFGIMLGTFLLVTKGQPIIPHLGDILLLLACLAWGLGGVLIRKILKDTTLSPDIVSFLRPVSGIPIIILFIVLSPLYPIQLQKVFQVNVFETNQTFYVVLNAIFVALTWIFVNRTLKVASASYTAMMSSVTPIIVAFLATVFLAEQIETIQFVGILLIIASSSVTHYLKIDKL